MKKQIRMITYLRNMLCEINNPEMNGFSLFNRIIDEQVIFHNEIKEELIYEKKD